MAVPATEDRKLRRDDAACFGSQSTHRRPVGFTTLDRMMHHVACYYGMSTARENVYAAMARRMVWRRCKGNRVIERIVIVYEQGLAGLHNRHAVVAKDPAGRVRTANVLRLPGVILSLVEDVFGVREGWPPAPIAQRGVPACMVAMQVCAEYIVDLFVVDPRCKTAPFASALSRGNQTVLGCCGYRISHPSWHKCVNGLLCH
jgi:hypothetical protein